MSAIRTWLVALASTAFLAVGVARAQPEATEAEVKAALVLRLAKYVTWPAERDPATTAPLIVCVVGDDPIAGSLRALSSAAARVDVRRVGGDSSDLLQCHIVVFGSDNAVDVNYALVRLAGQPVLTIGATERFARTGGILALVNRDGRIAFVVNNDAARRGHLAISSRLLQIASVVTGGAP